jgi:hypothetical protein
MDQYKGILKLDILGSQRGFKFGTMQAALFCKELNVKLSDMSNLLDGSDIEAQIVWYWSAAVAYSRLFKEPEPSKDEVAAWIDTYGYEKMEAETIETNKVPNEETPATLGEQSGT